MAANLEQIDNACLEYVSAERSAVDACTIALELERLSQHAPQSWPLASSREWLAAMQRLVDAAKLHWVKGGSIAIVPQEAPAAKPHQMSLF